LAPRIRTTAFYGSSEEIVRGFGLWVSVAPSDGAIFCPYFRQHFAPRLSLHCHLPITVLAVKGPLWAGEWKTGSLGRLFHFILE
jgi:hypothetical protein